eukprot:TRINITY_DN8638_c0_g1::TRINITY_DN8638_c0_g1_i1::g.398::m.398 TRINITY_DN8638_c0_g1::TRINITY_DN8638_c0_g1_i1::g.398  ORF type:complete len:219 (+),score=31.20,sp/Q5R4W3/DPOE3_PONAB/37.11/6e-15,CBFD_NFYB_HMF/PF00808.18/1.8e-07,CBFD_NFYB_HMF/PF00808.18/1e+04,Histone/PF00125.19/5.6e-05,CENP-S/PF15630.1/0.084 TRINITY_DN8638_c0_g1_i1:114-770(+)
MILTFPSEIALPKAVVKRVASGAIPKEIRTEKDAVLALQNSATVFVQYLSAMSNDICRESGKRTTINSDDVMAAVRRIEFQRFIPELEKTLRAFRAEASEKRRHTKEKSQATDSAQADSGEPETTTAAADDAEADNDEAEGPDALGIDPDENDPDANYDDDETVRPDKPVPVDDEETQLKATPPSAASPTPDPATNDIIDSLSPSPPVTDEIQDDDDS